MSLPASFLSKYSSYSLFSENRRFEILDGELSLIRTPGTDHQAVSLRMATALFQFVEAGNLGQVFQAPYNVMLSPGNVVQPDILFIRRERRGMIGEMGLRGTPDLVIEVLSRRSRERDIKIKRMIYARFEVPEYWIVDPAINAVEVLVWSEMGYASAGVYGKSGRLGSPLLPDLKLSLSSIFQTEKE